MRRALPAVALVGCLVREPAAAAQFTDAIDLVEVYASVADRDGRPIRGLTADRFVVREDGRPQAVGAFATGDVPLSLAVAIDRSFSVSSQQLTSTTDAVREFFGALRPADRVMVLAIGSRVETLAPLSADRGAAALALERLERWGSTPLYDAARTAIEAIQGARGRRALVLLSDGADRYSETSAAALIDFARRQDVLIYPVAIGRRRPPVFAELATVTGGRSFGARDRVGLRAVLGTIAEDLRTQYLLGYAPARRAGDQPGWHSITVTVDRPDARVRARDGYVSR